MQLMTFVNKVTQHDRTAPGAITHRTQKFGFALIICIEVNPLFSWNQVHSRGTPFFGLQCVSGTTEKHTRGSGSNLQLASAGRTWNVRICGFIGPHPGVFILRGNQFLGKNIIKRIKHTVPLGMALGHFVELGLHVGGETIIH